MELFEGCAGHPEYYKYKLLTRLESTEAGRNWTQKYGEKNENGEYTPCLIKNIYESDTTAEGLDQEYIQNKIDQEIKNKQSALLNETRQEIQFANTVVGKRQIIDNCKKIIQDNFPGISLAKEKVVQSNLVYIYPKKDIISRTCPIAKRTHNSNTVYFVCNILARCCLVQCFDENCRNQKQELQPGENLIKDIVCEPFCKRNKKYHYGTAKDLSYIKQETFTHTPLFVDVGEIFDIYKLYKYVIIEAKLKEKRPSFNNWQKNEFDFSKTIDLSKSNIAIVTGINSNLCVLDIDIKDNGLNYFQKLCTANSYNYTNETLAVVTPTNGIHLYYKYNENLSKNSVRIKDENGNNIGLDIRSDSGCVIAPPSKYDWGSYYFISLKGPQEMPQFISDLFI